MPRQGLTARGKLGSAAGIELVIDLKYPTVCLAVSKVGIESMQSSLNLIATAGKREVLTWGRHLKLGFSILGARTADSKI
jgi:hypothetical protein